jgi:hypothetical protein
MESKPEIVQKIMEHKTEEEKIVLSPEEQKAEAMRIFQTVNGKDQINDNLEASKEMFESYFKSG